MSEPTKAEAKAKLAKLKIEIGAPNRDLDYTVQPMGRGSFGSNMLIASTWRHREEMKRIGRGNADRRWDVLPQQPALAYDIAQNRLIVSAAMLQAPVLDMSQDAAGQYGTFGALVGHELSHGVDNKGRLVDAAGTVKTWWTPADDAAWDTRAGKLAAQYSGYPYPGLATARVNGALTKDEDMADLAGVELAWAALTTAQTGLEKPAKQAFYQSWARLWQQQTSQDVATRNAAIDVHAPGQWRANGPLVNQPAFAETYTCKATPRCSARPRIRFPSGVDRHAGRSRPSGARWAEQAGRSWLLRSEALPHDARPRRTALAERRLPAPVADQQPAEQHAAQVREMRDAGLPAGEAKQQFDRAVDDHQRARLHRDRRDQQHHALVREQHAVGEQQSEHAARCADGRISLPPCAIHDATNSWHRPAPTTQTR